MNFGRNTKVKIGSIHEKRGEGKTIAKANTAEHFFGRALGPASPHWRFLWLFLPCLPINDPHTIWQSMLPFAPSKPLLRIFLIAQRKVPTNYGAHRNLPTPQLSDPVFLYQPYDLFRLHDDVIIRERPGARVRKPFL